MVIREMVEVDIPELAQLYRQFWGEESCIENMRKQFVKFQENNSHILISAIENRKLVGSVMGVICEELYGDCRPFVVLENMIVDKNYRNNGVGKALISELERVATKRKCTQVLLVTESNRIDACKFYESVGYSTQTHKGFKKKL